MEQYIQTIQYVQSQLPGTDISEKNIKAIMINTKNANTFTGTQGAEALDSLSKNLAKNLTLREAQKKGGTSQVIKPNEILFASTGVIGEKFPTQQIKIIHLNLLKN